MQMLGQLHKVSQRVFLKHNAAATVRVRSQRNVQLLLSLALRAIRIHRRDISVDVHEHLEAYTSDNLNRLLLQTSLNHATEARASTCDLEVCAAAHACLC